MSLSSSLIALCQSQEPHINNLNDVGYRLQEEEKPCAYNDLLTALSLKQRPYPRLAITRSNKFSPSDDFVGPVQLERPTRAMPLEPVHVKSGKQSSVGKNRPSGIPFDLPRWNYNIGDDRKKACGRAFGVEPPKVSEGFWKSMKLTQGEIQLRNRQTKSSVVSKRAPPTSNPGQNLQKSMLKVFPAVTVPNPRACSYSPTFTRKRSHSSMVTELNSTCMTSFITHSEDVDDPDRLNDAQIEKLFAYQLQQANNALQSDTDVKIECARPKSKVGAIEIALKAARRDMKGEGTMPPIDNLPTNHWTSSSRTSVNEVVADENQSPVINREKSSRNTKHDMNQPTCISKSLTLFSMSLPGEPVKTPITKSTKLYKSCMKQSGRTGRLVTNNWADEDVHDILLRSSPSEPTSDFTKENLSPGAHCRSPIRLPNIAFKDAGYESACCSDEYMSNDDADYCVLKLSHRRPSGKSKGSVECSPSSPGEARLNAAHVCHCFE
ncbi:hypothetical protein CAPTEDRAFT_204108 [Capitella teleta]|uniref:Uncharacterized protein n=1 Tax=Capitella teleta TaxID=283909 RepID=R7UU98_CAPTE|nr:hypothetical protein CAPTEDRAFT_204108 [Capitella teleta]|eukprot:ELU07497.1 hypothetical protein CAPTEDRAFT_204108 [Capitella teleta]